MIERKGADARRHAESIFDYGEGNNQEEYVRRMPGQVVPPLSYVVSGFSRTSWAPLEGNSTFTVHPLPSSVLADGVSVMSPRYLSTINCAIASPSPVQSAA